MKKMPDIGFFHPALTSSAEETSPPGAVRQDDGSVKWTVWCPLAERVELVVGEGGSQRVFPMERDEQEYHTFRLAEINEGIRYCYRVNNSDYPDPASRWQPEGVHRPSAVFTPGRFEWTDAAWDGVARQDLILYEIHVGTFTPEGTFEAVIPRLKDLRTLGITAIEIMPIAQFPGKRNWGYDGVSPYAAQNSYGGPAGLQALVDAAHAEGLGVLLDVVYNHLGPEGNYLSRFGPYFTDAYHTPWGSALNFDGPDSDAVRQYVIQNAVMWIRDFHLDGLRLDAVHAIYDFGALHLLTELQQAVQRIALEQHRSVHVIAESDQNDPRLIDPPTMHGMGLDGVWADEFHHSVKTILTGQREGYFQAFGEPAHLAKAIENVFVYDGCYSPFRRRRHGAPIGERDRTKFVVCIHNHDQIGNRPFGDRSPTYLSQPAQRLACGLLLITPCIPMLFMGEEYAEENPFPFFCSFEDKDLVEAVRTGRRQEFTGHGFQWADDIPDPQAEKTFQSAVLSWSWPEGTFHYQLRELYRDLLHARRLWAPLRDRRHTRARVVDTEGASLLIVERGREEKMTAVANLSDKPQKPLAPNAGALLFSTEEQRYGGKRQLQESIEMLAPWEMVIWGNLDWKR